MRDTEGGAAVLLFLQEHGPTTVREVAAAVFPDAEPTTSSSAGYMRAYNWLLSLERVSAAQRKRTPATNGSSAFDEWTAIEGAVAPTQVVRARDAITRKRARPSHWRRVRLTERMWLELLGVMNDAVIDSPEDVDLRKLRNIVSAAARETTPAEVEPVAEVAE